MIRNKVALSLAGLLWVASLAAQTITVKPWPIREVPGELRPLVARAEVMIAEMQHSLLRQLSDKLADGGPAQAINACHMDTTALTYRFGRREGIAAGFTSDRLRNPTNKPRPWAAEIVRANAGLRARDVEGFAVDLGDKVGVIRPIAQQKMCAGCHGTPSRMNPAVRDVLTDRYPVDRATGFNEGEIRGWFWIEIPKSTR